MSSIRNRRNDHAFEGCNGRTGAIGILGAGDRVNVNLLPFALLVTRLGGALTVLIALQAATVLQS
jgi:Na+/citrate or Na+/malate symporter